jgi:nitrate reductase beta subunit
MYLAGLFAGGNEEEVKAVYRRLIAVRIQRRALSVGDMSDEEVEKAREISGLNSDALDAIFRMTSLTRIKERIVVPPMLREQAIEADMNPEEYKQGMGFGSRTAPSRRWYFWAFSTFSTCRIWRRSKSFSPQPSICRHSATPMSATNCVEKVRRAPCS